MKYFQLLQKKPNFVSSRKMPYVPSDDNHQSPIDVQINSRAQVEKGLYNKWKNGKM